MEFSQRVLILCSAWIFVAQVHIGTGQSRSSLRDCPKKPELIGSRRCLKSCTRENKCRGRRRTCLCDDVCGMSCVNPNLKCKDLSNVANGRVQIIPYSKFNAVANYSCVPGYLLRGERTRICVGDGSWTGSTPICTSSDSSCRRPPDVENALCDKKVGPYPVGTQVQYYCRRGYYRDGQYTATCGDQGAWIGPRMSCIPKGCNHPGDIEHGIRKGDLFFYPHRVDYRCIPGYQLIGPSYRVCRDDGAWSKELPFCTPVQCPVLFHPMNGKIVFGNSISYTSTIEFRCNPGYRLIGTNKRTCQANATWTGENVLCELIDCGVPEFYNGVLEGDRTTLGAEIRFVCYPGTTLDGPTVSAECLITGEWSFPPPKCWSKCVSPTIEHGHVTRRNQNAEHTMVLDFSCDDGYNKKSANASRCYNGTWIDEPNCVPAPCKTRPPTIQNGEYRYVSTNHEDRVLYECNIGYDLMNDRYLECRFGDWRGRTPWCKPQYCQFPGYVKHGKILLVGVRGKYEYRHYVPNIGQGQQIEYHCDRDYKLKGVLRSTCINGHWSPRPRQQKCVRGTHINLPFRFRFFRVQGN